MVERGAARVSRSQVAQYLGWLAALREAEKARDDQAARVMELEERLFRTELASIIGDPAWRSAARPLAMAPSFLDDLRRLPATDRTLALRATRAAIVRSPALLDQVLDQRPIPPLGEPGSVSLRRHGDGAEARTATATHRNGRSLTVHYWLRLDGSVELAGSTQPASQSMEKR